MVFKNISANTLFHFTSKIEYLEGILINGFKPRYCLEDHRMFMPDDFILKEHFHRAIPMVCFCDIPLSQIGNHSRTYGSYAIGMSKEWAKKRMINPITYSLPGTYTTQLIMETYKELLKYLSNDKDELRRNELIAALNTVGGKLHRLLNILKPYEGRLWRNGEFSNHIFRFYDEREWRYVPDIYKLQKDSLSMEEFLNSETRELENEKLSLINTLNFTPHDIKYIIVKDETEVLDFMRKVETIKSHFSKNDVKLLTSKIITMEQIKEDF